MREGFGEMKNGMRIPEMNLIFKLFQNSALPICTYLGSPSGLSPAPWALLPDRLRREIPFIPQGNFKSK